MRKALHPVEPLTDVEWEALCATCNPRCRLGLRDRAILELLRYCGLRAREVCRLRREDLVWDAEVPFVQVRKSKFDKDRDVPLLLVDRQVVEAWLAVAPESEWLFCTLRGVQKGAVVSKPIGSQCTNHVIEGVCHRASSRANVFRRWGGEDKRRKGSPDDPRPVWSHLFRHGLVTNVQRWALERGIFLDEADVQAWVGHTQLATTARYMHASSSRLKQKLLMSQGPARGLWASQAGSLPVLGSGECKTCPDCAEDVKQAARICKHCRFEFAAA